jgi:hypothetical protein
MEGRPPLRLPLPSKMHAARLKPRTKKLAYYSHFVLHELLAPFDFPEQSGKDLFEINQFKTHRLWAPINYALLRLLGSNPLRRGY